MHSAGALINGMKSSTKLTWNRDFGRRGGRNSRTDDEQQYSYHH